MRRPAVSIVIPCYNDGRFLPDAVASVEACSGPMDCELLVVNDGSTDPATLEVLGEIRRRGHRVLDQRNRGLGAARNLGISQASGEYILPLDSDNRIFRGYLDRGIEVLSNRCTVGVVYGDAEYFGERSGRWVVPEFSDERLMRGNFIDACAVFRRSAWESVGGYDERMPIMGWEDWDFWLRLSLRNWEFVHVPEILFAYRVRHQSMLWRSMPHGQVLLDYIMRKPECRPVALWRERDEACRRLAAELAGITNSRLVRIARRVSAVLQRIRRLCSSKRSVAEARSGSA